ncbi:MAG: hypothetical protein J3K34DRAFT_285045 [Monoraphidium minutum]|nr:MAG: hypothetical protein J3K34DRAFT_285045 [Monoraphidium minutum]
MGLCPSKPSAVEGPEKAGASNAAQSAAAAAAPPAAAQPCCTVAAAEAGDTLAHAPGEAPHAARYSSNSTPGRSAMRTSLDGGGASAGGGASDGGAGAGSGGGNGLVRKSMSSDGSALARVRFAPDAPAACLRTSPDHRRSYEAADSVSLKKIVDLFYERVMDDPRLAAFFGSVDLVKLKSHQVQFMALAFGGKDLVLADYPDMNLHHLPFCPNLLAWILQPTLI